MKRASNPSTRPGAGEASSSRPPLPAAIARENVKLAALDIEKGVPQRRDRPEVGKGDHHDIGLHSKLVPHEREDRARDLAAGSRER